MQSVVATTGSRLHFGLLGFGHPGERQWGGLGVMIDRPVTKVRIATADRLIATGPEAERALAIARNWSRAGGTCREVGARIEILESPPPHVGLGSGTQLALAIGEGLDQVYGRRSRIQDLAQRVGRTGRSSVGTLGFCLGGLIYDLGKLPGESVGSLGDRIDLPEAWRFALVRPRGSLGVCGETETKAFRDLPASDSATTYRLKELVEAWLLPAAKRGDIDSFGVRLTEYNRLAGSFYESIQKGPYINAEVAALVERLKKAGARGAGQTSWGPTVFALMPSDNDARRLLAEAGVDGDNRLEVDIVAPLNRASSTIKEA